MKKSGFTEEQTIGFIKQAEAAFLRFRRLKKPRFCAIDFASTMDQRVRRAGRDCAFDSCCSSCSNRRAGS